MATDAVRVRTSHPRRCGSLYRYTGRFRTFRSPPHPTFSIFDGEGAGATHVDVARLKRWDSALCPAAVHGNDPEGHKTLLGRHGEGLRT